MFLRFLAFLIPAMAALSVAARPETSLPPTVAKALAAAQIPSSAVGVVVQEVGATTPRLELNAGTAMNPASTMKLVTTLAALELLGPAYTWKTSAWSNAPLDNGVLAGDLVLRGGADPRLTFEQFWLLLRQVRARGVRQIAGDLVLDRGLIAAAEADSHFDDKPLRPYNVSPDALLLNFKAVRLRLVPDADKQTVMALAEPEPVNLDITNLIKLRAGNGGCGDWKESLRADLSQHANRWRLVLTGGYPAACGEKTWNHGLLPHPAYIHGVFEQLWRELGGSLRGDVRDGAVPADARQLGEIESPSLAEIVRDINKYSNNVMARQLFLTLGIESLAERGRRPARTEDADAAVRGWLDSRGLRFPELVLDNGSGLSRRERIAAGNLARLLSVAWQSPLMPEFVASLPLNAVDGTMKKRLNGNGITGRAHIKTGTLEGVKTIAGYVLDRNGRQQIVVFLVNHANAGAAQAAQDALLTWVYESAR
ncbi:MAG: D-alanyl-D-alanine carboxypeptidase/D-alanyl-D-alanine-endopeptidase [Rhodocyclaceae bacterium]|nr:D-alanyl-D-alanine carboxypeptidase/D-alanyl-D-alanine-endopeptidase [Rhodocyclaceae bacterium]MBK6552934.1 D-alanyl-D-alanine carboxypeptidase/D-alanyl-D-alanine-endopeptidase [Rhodocyclaceae bacterium]MBK9312469.1 D-alanyl-D-alanine carboxypeptidase/D-alanyl-D-alanine-endopeptidase [Rhodocyclaceae bacterium]